MKCKNCEKKKAIKYSKYSNGEFCSKECSRSFSTKEKRKEINLKVSQSLKGKGNNPVENSCFHCKKKFVIEWKRRDQKFCSKECQNNGREYSEESRKSLSKHAKKRNGTLEGRKRMRDIGRKGGFGKKGFTTGGNRYESSIEKKCFEFLEMNKISFVPHKKILNSSKVSDVYFEEKDLWIEIDGINREKRKKWLESNYKYWIDKIQIYEDNNLNYKVVTSFKDFVDLINKIGV